jgi:hypothetical protein
MLMSMFSFVFPSKSSLANGKREFREGHKHVTIYHFRGRQALTNNQAGMAEKTGGYGK